MSPGTETRPRHSHIWAREVNEHYVEPSWVSERLFDKEDFVGGIHDPCCGFGTVVQAAIAAGLTASGADIVDRGFAEGKVEDFFTTTAMRDNFVFNPPFDRTRKLTRAFIRHALAHSRDKTAVIFPVASLNAARWLQDLPLRRVWLLSPRPSMPPGSYIAASNKPEGGRVDFCWLLFETGFDGCPEMAWLRG